jgi:hypothetical protein
LSKIKAGTGEFGQQAKEDQCRGPASHDPGSDNAHRNATGKVPRRATAMRTRAIPAAVPMSWAAAAHSRNHRRGHATWCGDSV